MCHAFARRSRACEWLHPFCTCGPSTWLLLSCLLALAVSQCSMPYIYLNVPRGAKICLFQPPGDKAAESRRRILPIMGARPLLATMDFQPDSHSIPPRYSLGHHCCRQSSSCGPVGIDNPISPLTSTCPSLHSPFSSLPELPRISQLARFSSGLGE